MSLSFLEKKFTVDDSAIKHKGWKLHR